MAKGIAAVILVITPQGIPVVREPGKPPPLYWKLPSGVAEPVDDPVETPEQCAWRELKGETGISLASVEKLRLFHTEDRGNHVRHFFRADLPVLPKLAERGDEGEEIAVMTPREILQRRREFLPPHFRVIEGILKSLC